MEELIQVMNVVCVWLMLRVLMYIPELVYYIHECMKIDRHSYKKNLTKDVNEILQERENAQK